MKLNYRDVRAARYKKSEIQEATAGTDIIISFLRTYNSFKFIELILCTNYCQLTLNSANWVTAASGKSTEPIHSYQFDTSLNEDHSTLDILK